MEDVDDPSGASIPKSAPDVEQIMTIHDVSDDDIPSSPLSQSGHDEVEGDINGYIIIREIQRIYIFWRKLLTELKYLSLT